MDSVLHGTLDDDLTRHYRHGALLTAILTALKEAGQDPEHLSADNLSAVDEFHTGGRTATVDLADQMDIAEGMSLLDVGSGIGGPSRYFAQHRGCTVTGIDLSAEYCETATELSSLAGLGDRTQYQQGNAASLPFPDQTFEGAYLLHVGMNIPGKAVVLGEVARVLKPGAVFAVFDMMREAEGDLTFPVPWASSAEMSFVETPATYRELLRDAGFEIVKERSRRDFAMAFFAKMREASAAAAASGAPPAPGIALVMGPSAPLKVGNLATMIQQGLLAPTEIICRK